MPKKSAWKWEEEAVTNTESAEVVRIDFRITPFEEDSSRVVYLAQKRIVAVKEQSLWISGCYMDVVNMLPLAITRMSYCQNSLSTWNYTDESRNCSFLRTISLIYDFLMKKILKK